MEVADAGVDVFGVEAVVFEAGEWWRSESSYCDGERGGLVDRNAPQKQSARRLPQPVVGEDVAVLPRDGLDGRQDGVALLPWRDEDG